MSKEELPTPLTETAPQAAHRNRRFMQTGTRWNSASACCVDILFLQNGFLLFHDEFLHLRNGKNIVHQLVKLLVSAIFEIGCNDFDDASFDGEAKEPPSSLVVFREIGPVSRLLKLLFGLFLLLCRFGQFLFDHFLFLLGFLNFAFLAFCHGLNPSFPFISFLAFDQDCSSSCESKPTLYANRHPLKIGECLVCRHGKNNAWPYSSSVKNENHESSITHWFLIDEVV